MEVRQLLTASPLDELNNKMNEGFNTATTEITQLFTNAASDFTSVLNGALGATSSEFFQFPLNGEMWTEAASNSVSDAFGQVEEAVVQDVSAVISGQPELLPTLYTLGNVYPSPPGGTWIQVYGQYGQYAWNPTANLFSASSQRLITLPAEPGVQSRTVLLQGQITRSANGTGWIDSFGLKQNYSEILTGGLPGDSLTLEYKRPFNQPAALPTLDVSARNVFENVTTYASLHMTGNVLNSWEVGGDGTFANSTISLKKSHSPSEDLLVARFDYELDNTKATILHSESEYISDRFKLTEAILSKLNNDGSYVQTGFGIGEHNGDSDAYFKLAAGLPVVSSIPYVPKYLVLSSTIHNGSMTQTTPQILFSSPNMSKSFLFLQHHLWIDEFDNMLTGGLQWQP